MFDSSVVDVVVGLALIFLVFSLVVSGVHEAVARVLSWRSKALWAGIHRLIDPPPDATTVPRNRLLHVAGEGDLRPAQVKPQDITGLIYAHPLIGGLEELRADAKTRIEGIEPSRFARALIDVIVPDGDGKTSVEVLRRRVSALPNDHPLRRQLLILVSETGDNLMALRTEIEGWFDSQMQALSREYRRRSKWFLLAFGLGVAVACNVDAISVAQRLYRDETVRTAVVAQAEGVSDACAGSEGGELTDCIEEQTAPLRDALPLPVGWQDFKFGWTTVVGWLLTGFALMQGAPFWFSLLQKAVAVRRRRNPGGAASSA